MALFVMNFGCLLATNVKFTGAAYALIFMAPVLLFIILKYKSLSLNENLMVIFCIVVTAFVSFPTYLTNFIRNGNPIYPLNRIDIPKGQIPDSFLGQDRWSKFVEATFLGVSNGATDIEKPNLFVPRLWHYEQIARRPDVEIGGFGSLFGWTILAALIAMIYTLWCQKGEALKGQGPWVVLIAMSCIILSSVINPEFWWARYVPQLWLFPIMVVVFAFMSGQKWMGVGVLSIAGAGSLLTSVFWLQQKEASAEMVNREMNRIETSRVAVVYDGQSFNHGLFTFSYLMNAKGIPVRFTNDRMLCSEKVGIVGICRGAGGSDILLRTVATAPPLKCGPGDR
jgi:hypothetical protein